LNAEYFYDILKAQQEEDAAAYAEELRVAAEAERKKTEDAINDLYQLYVNNLNAMEYA
jgi:hypothetical protein